VTTDSSGSKVALGQDFSKNVIDEDGLKLALQTGGSYDFKANNGRGSGNAYVGAFATKQVSDDVQLYAGTTAGLNDVGRSNDFAVGFEVGANIGDTKKSSASQDLAPAVNSGAPHQREQSANVVVAQSADAKEPNVHQSDDKPTQAQRDKPNHEIAQASETYHALSNNPTKQAAFLNQMADTIAKNIGGDSAAVADILQQRFESYSEIQR
jgi:hypothetical protein